MNISIVPVAPTMITTASGHAYGLINRRTVAPIPSIAIDSGSNGAIPHASRSAQLLLVNRRKNRIIPAIGRSTIRLQWMSKPTGGFSR